MSASSRLVRSAVQGGLMSGMSLYFSGACAEISEDLG
jgi:hypothetical protein